MFISASPARSGNTLQALSARLLNRAQASPHLVLCKETSVEVLSVATLEESDVDGVLTAEAEFPLFGRLLAAAVLPASLAGGAASPAASTRAARFAFPEAMQFDSRPASIPLQHKDVLLITTQSGHLSFLTYTRDSDVSGRDKPSLVALQHLRVCSPGSPDRVLGGLLAVSPEDGRAIALASRDGRVVVLSVKEDEPTIVARQHIDVRLESRRLVAMRFLPSSTLSFNPNMVRLAVCWTEPSSGDSGVTILKCDLGRHAEDAAARTSGSMADWAHQDTVVDCVGVPHTRAFPFDSLVLVQLEHGVLFADTSHDGTLSSSKPRSLAAPNGERLRSWCLAGPPRDRRLLFITDSGRLYWLRIAGHNPFNPDARFVELTSDEDILAPSSSMVCIPVEARHDEGDVDMEDADVSLPNVAFPSAALELDDDSEVGAADPSSSSSSSSPAKRMRTEPAEPESPAADDTSSRSILIMGGLDGEGQVVAVDWEAADALVSATSAAAAAAAAAGSGDVQMLGNTEPCLELVSTLPNLAPLSDCVIVENPNDLQHHMIALCNRTLPRSSEKLSSLCILRNGLATPLVSAAPPGFATGVTRVITVRQGPAAPHHALVVFSFKDTTRVMSGGEALEDITSDLGVCTDQPTLGCGFLDELGTLLVQIVPHGALVLRCDGDAKSARPASRWAPPDDWEIVHAHCLASAGLVAVVVAQTGDPAASRLVLLHTDSAGNMAPASSVDLPRGETSCLSASRDPLLLLFVGTHDGAVHVARIEPGPRSLTTLFSLQLSEFTNGAPLTIAESIAPLACGGFSYICVGLRDGHLLCFRIVAEGPVRLVRHVLRRLGDAPVKLSVAGAHSLIALSDRAWHVAVRSPSDNAAPLHPDSVRSNERLSCSMLCVEHHSAGEADAAEGERARLLHVQAFSGPLCPDGLVAVNQHAALQFFTIESSTRLNVNCVAMSAPLECICYHHGARVLVGGGDGFLLLIDPLSCVELFRCDDVGGAVVSIVRWDDECVLVASRAREGAGGRVQLFRVRQRQGAWRVEALNGVNFRSAPLGVVKLSPLLFAVWHSARRGYRIVICDIKLARSVDQIRFHTRVLHVEAKLLPCENADWSFAAVAQMDAAQCMASPFHTTLAVSVESASMQLWRATYPLPADGAEPPQSSAPAASESDSSLPSQRSAVSHKVQLVQTGLDPHEHRTVQTALLDPRTVAGIDAFGSVFVMAETAGQPDAAPGQPRYLRVLMHTTIDEMPGLIRSGSLLPESARAPTADSFLVLSASGSTHVFHRLPAEAAPHAHTLGQVQHALARHPASRPLSGEPDLFGTFRSRIAPCTGVIDGDVLVVLCSLNDAVKLDVMQRANVGDAEQVQALVDNLLLQVV